MIGRDSNDDIDLYGAKPWIAGLIFSGALIALMFGLAAGFA
ncbi:hypothetical protein ADIMK_0205 [Marinobacterium lacunae]|uniref:Uncharacterized protein n=1 Tax=Marinobacterium lacunae TaxID=1232683 RepID=A0A081G4H8_9GAMM|nr:hypothetical protein [Marinobacterium lacunae]KEA65683.1 hypothetical protein ADIMK_0205 [Marinobacterium lacunae]